MLVTYPQLEAELKTFLVGLKEHGLHQDYALFHSLYTFGFRIQELRECHTWKLTSKGEITCQPSKKSNLRYIDAQKAHKLLIDSIKYQKNFIYISSYSTYRRIFEARIKGEGYRLGQKKLSTHIFRHAIAKRLHNQGESSKEIQSYLGLQSHEITLGYIHSPIEIWEK